MGKSFFIVAALVLTLGCAKAQVDPVSSLNSVDFESITLEIGGKHYEVEYAKTFRWSDMCDSFMECQVICEKPKRDWIYLPIGMIVFVLSLSFLL